MADARDNDPTAGKSAADLDASPPDAPQARRALADVETSIKAALGPLAVAPNDEATWATAVTTVTDVLENLRAAGGLAGVTASGPFTVKCGLGRTMTAQDILEGYMIVQVVLQMIRPAEFIELTIKQWMQGSR